MHRLQTAAGPAGNVYLRGCGRFRSRFMITACIWVSQSVFRPAAIPGSLVRTCITSRSGVPESNSNSVSPPRPSTISRGTRNGLAPITGRRRLLEFRAEFNRRVALTTIRKFSVHAYLESFPSRSRPRSFYRPYYIVQRLSAISTILLMRSMLRPLRY